MTGRVKGLKYSSSVAVTNVELAGRSEALGHGACGAVVRCGACGALLEHSAEATGSEAQPSDPQRPQHCGYGNAATALRRRLRGTAAVTNMAY